MQEKSISNPNTSDVGGKKRKDSWPKQKLVRTHQLAENNIHIGREFGGMSFSGRWYIPDTVE